MQPLVQKNGNKIPNPNKQLAEFIVIVSIKSAKHISSLQWEQQDELVGPKGKRVLLFTGSITKSLWWRSKKKITSNSNIIKTNSLGRPQSYANLCLKLTISLSRVTTTTLHSHYCSHHFSYYPSLLEHIQGGATFFLPKRDTFTG